MSLLVPSSRLLTGVGDNPETRKFSLASKEWFDLQVRVNAVLALPSNMAEFEVRYGDPSSGSQMKDVFDAMEKLRWVATRYGNPGILRGKITKDPNFLAADRRPKNDAYSATLWTVQRAHQDAFSLASALSVIPENARNEPPAEVVGGIQSLFLASDGIVNKMRRTHQSLEKLITEFEGLETELEASQLAMNTYTGRSSNTMTALSRDIGELEATIKQLQKDRKAAYDKWLALTILAVTVAATIAVVGVAVGIVLAPVSGFSSAAVGPMVAVGVAAAAGTGLGIAAGVARSSYDGLVTKVNKKNAFLQKRIAYRHDLGALDDLMKFTLPASAGLVGDVGVVRDAWANSIEEINRRVSGLTVSNLSDGPWLNDVAMKAAAAKWSLVDDALKAFSVGSFVDAELIDFGSAMPADDPEWQEKLENQFAA